MFMYKPTTVDDKIAKSREREIGNMKWKNAGIMEIRPY